MPRAKPSVFIGPAELNAMIERVAPDILGLPADGVLGGEPAALPLLHRPFPCW
jgi:hypothetical protein